MFFQLKASVFLSCQITINGIDSFFSLKKYIYNITEYSQRNVTYMKLEVRKMAMKFMKVRSSIILKFRLFEFGFQ
ncbi:hypothetical protein DO021_20280 [Desulfobacter hydrogenophilus]|uniref:Uncharacterized protein n=1 Tax=Desulfobacter hydrogenophilus TaxID=2291 RepID=A0A328F6Q6_9BACT|nr:hypothetical protein DO021_20280 [Desulfobacter hydrogenophilus]